MKLLRVIPLVRGIPKEELSYFSAKEIVPGDIVTILLRKTKRNAVVTHVSDAEEAKATLRALPYAMKKIITVKRRGFFLPWFLAAAEDVASMFAATRGAVLYALLPQAIIEMPQKNKPSLLERLEVREKVLANTTPHIALLQAPDDERLSAYRGIVREEFARGRSVFFCLPEISEIERLKNELKKGIEEYTFVLHSTLPKKEICDVWTRAEEESHPVLIIATASFLSAPRHDLGAIIIEKESARTYKMPSRPFLDFRVVAEICARRANARLILGDVLLRTETLHREETGEVTELSPLVFRSLSPAKNFLIDMRVEQKRKSGKFQLLSDELLELATRLKEENGRLFLFAARRGLYPLVACADCGTEILCRRCSAPVVIHAALSGDTKNTKRFALCHKCGEKSEAPDRCAVCKGWRLSSLGVGIEQAEEELGKKFPGLAIRRLDRDSARTHKKATEIRDAFYASPGGVLLGTEMAIPYLYWDIENVAVLSVDALFSIPDIRMNERVATTLLRLRSRAQKRFIIQTRMPEHPTFRAVLQGNMADFYREELAERKTLNYPPFTVLIKITREGTRGLVEKDMEELVREFADYTPAIFPAFTETVRGKYQCRALLKLPRGAWPDDTLLTKLRALPPTFSIEVHPNDVL